MSGHVGHVWTTPLGGVRHVQVCPSPSPCLSLRCPVVAVPGTDLPDADQATICRYILGEQIPSVPIVVKIRDLSGGAVGLDDWAPEKKIRRRDALLPGV
jgi:hypothetical protein